MPLRWQVDHGARLIVATASGSLARQDFDDYVAALDAEGAIGYRVIFDMRAAAAVFRRADLAALSAMVSSRRRDDVSDGRVAVVVESEAEEEMAGHFVDLTQGQRPCRLFRNMQDARHWLDGPG